MDGRPQLDETTIEDGGVGCDSINYGESQKLNAYGPWQQESENGPSGPGPTQGPSKKPRLEDICPPMYYPRRMNVETSDVAAEHIQTAWEGIAQLGDDLTDEDINITLDFREPLRGSDEMLTDASTEDTLDHLATKIVTKCTMLSRFCVKVGTEPLECEYEDDEDTEPRTTDAQWQVVGTSSN